MSLSFKRQPKAFGAGEVPVGRLPTVERADLHFTHAYRAMVEANAAANGLEFLFGSQVALAVSKPVTNAMLAMEALWGAVDTLADEMPAEVFPYVLRNELVRRGALHERRICQTSGCPQMGLLVPEPSSDCPQDHVHVTVYVYDGGEDPEPF